ncbi:MAG: iron donor protein CyaY [Porticoccus sp.]|jgi:CyaY protein|nr:iron donor protein CyaY [Porticoccus sp.]
MNEMEFNNHCDEIMLAIEEAVDSSPEDIDYETSAGVLTLTIETNGSKVIISRQPTQAQIWIAAKSGGYYCNHISGSWVCTTTSETLGLLLHRVCFEQHGGEIVFDI